MLLQQIVDGESLPEAAIAQAGTHSHPIDGIVAMGFKVAFFTVRNQHEV